MSKGRLPQSRRVTIASLVLIVSSLALLCFCLGYLIFEVCPNPECLDFVSGHVPVSARERFIHRVIEATREENYGWVARVVSDDSVIQDLKALQPNMTDNYTIRFSDDLAGEYDYNIHFDNGTVLHFILFGVWPECPDPDVTEQEIFQYLRLSHVSDVSEHYR